MSQLIALPMWFINLPLFSQHNLADKQEAGLVSL